MFNQSGNNPAVGGYAHWSISGGAIYNGTSIEMQTRKSTQPSVDNGTAYGIVYPFKIGYNLSGAGIPAAAACTDAGVFFSPVQLFQ